MEENQPAPAPDEVTRVLAQVSKGTPAADTRLLQIVYGELKRIAAAKMAAQDVAHTLQPTALVHEAYMRLMGGALSTRAYRDSSHFFTTAAAAMRSILVDHARRKKALKRGGGAQRITLHEDLAGESHPLDRILLVHESLERLAEEHPRSGEVVELLFFAGLPIPEAAEVLGVTYRTVEREWRFARAKLLKAMEEA